MWNGGNVILKPIYVKKELGWLNDATEDVTEPTYVARLCTIKNEDTPDARALEPPDTYLNPYMEMEVNVKIEHSINSAGEYLPCVSKMKSPKCTAHQKTSMESDENLKLCFSPEELLAFRDCFVKLERMDQHKNIDKFIKNQFNSNFKKVSFKKLTHKSERRHLASLTNLICRSKDKAIEKSCAKKSQRLKISKKNISEKLFRCNVCRKIFKSKYSLINHEQIHTGDRPHSCAFCNKSFSKSVNLIRHERIHTGEKTFCCDICLKQFSVKTNLIAHIRIHTQDKPFSCVFCNKQFVHASDLKKHERIHTGEKPFTCDICMKQFARKYCLVKHLRTHTKKKKIKKCNRKKK